MQTKGVSLKEAEGRGPSRSFSACHWETGTWGGVGWHIFILPPAPPTGQSRRGAPWQLAATVPFVDEKGAFL